MGISEEERQTTYSKSKQQAMLLMIVWLEVQPRKQDTYNEKVVQLSNVLRIDIDQDENL